MTIFRCRLFFNQFKCENQTVDPLNRSSRYRKKCRVYRIALSTITFFGLLYNDSSDIVRGIFYALYSAMGLFDGWPETFRAQVNGVYNL